MLNHPLIYQQYPYQIRYLLIARNTFFEYQFFVLFHSHIVPSYLSFHITRLRVAFHASGEAIPPSPEVTTRAGIGEPLAPIRRYTGANIGAGMADTLRPARSTTAFEGAAVIMEIGRAPLSRRASP